MNKSKLFTWVSSAAVFAGLGMIAGFSLAQGTSSLPLWLGGILLVLGAVAFGIALGSKSGSKSSKKEDAAGEK